MNIAQALLEGYRMACHRMTQEQLSNYIKLGGDINELYAEDIEVGVEYPYDIVD